MATKSRPSGKTTPIPELSQDDPLAAPAPAPTPDTAPTSVPDTSPAKNARELIFDLKQRISASVIGQDSVVEQLLMALLADGHILMEGLPGLAKTRTIKTLAKNLESR